LLAKVLGAKDRQLLAYSCLATVTDLQPVADFNRTIVKQGLEILNDQPPLGLQMLMDIAGKKGREVTTYDLGWLLGPRLNASGRVEDASLSLQLLLEDEEEKARELAWELNKINTQRQDKTFEMYEIAASYEDEELPRVIISHHDNYHEGIIGLVASRLVKKYYRPSIVLSTSEEVYKGSVRSIAGVNIIEFLREMDDLFISLGGHPMAAGFSIKAELFEEFKEKVEKLAAEKIDTKFFTRILEIDMSIPSEIIRHELVEKLAQLRPYGLGNRQPVFATFNLGIANMNHVGRENQHLSLRLFDGDNFFRAILFNAQDHDLDLSEGDMVDVAYTLKTNHYNGNIYLDLVLKDIKKSN
jgi:single-stranded-DNA-specific exonuclease